MDSSSPIPPHILKKKARAEVLLCISERIVTLVHFVSFTKDDCDRDP
jgi:hypothetical protein